ncbi:unnamed protein product, partial [Nesidiocoris tenuis]
MSEATDLTTTIGRQWATLAGDIGMYVFSVERSIYSMVISFRKATHLKKSEDNRNDYLIGPYHSRGGYLTVQESPWRTPLVLAFLQAGEELGYPNRDINGRHQTGFMIAQ